MRPFAQRHIWCVHHRLAPSKGPKLYPWRWRKSSSNPLIKRSKLFKQTEPPLIYNSSERALAVEFGIAQTVPRLNPKGHANPKQSFVSYFHGTDWLSLGDICDTSVCRISQRHLRHVFAEKPMASAAIPFGAIKRQIGIMQQLSRF